MPLLMNSSYGKLIMLLMDHDNNKIATECNDNLTYANIAIFSFGNDVNVITNYNINGLTSAINAVMNYYK